jgi:hypothetical protein
MFAELSMDHAILKDVISKKGWGPANKGNWQSRSLRIMIFLLARPVNW